jgi:alanine racemase
MNMMTIDVTNIETVKKDDEVVLIGSQNELSVSSPPLVILVIN